MADAPNIGTALQTASRLAKFPLPVTMGAVFESFEQTGDEAQQTPPALEELSGFPAKDSLVLRHVLPPSTTIQPLRAVGISASTSGDLCLVGVAASDSAWPDKLPREAWFILSVGATPLCQMQTATVSHVSSYSNLRLIRICPPLTTMTAPSWMTPRMTPCQPWPGFAYRSAASTVSTARLRLCCPWVPEHTSA